MDTPGAVPPDADDVALWNLMSEYNWDDGFAVPLAVVQHAHCDRALALRLFWELDDAARIHLSDEENALREHYSAEAAYAPENFKHIVAYATTLTGRLRRGDYPDGANEYDTGYMSVDLRTRPSDSGNCANCAPHARDRSTTMLSSARR